MLEAIIQQKINSLDITAGFLSGLSGFSQTKISQGLSGLRRLQNSELETIFKTLTKLEELVKVCSPIPVNFKNPVVIRQLLHDFENGTLTIQVKSGD